MLRIITLLMVLSLIIAPAFARNYRINAIADYGGNGDLSNDDAEVFDDYMGKSTYLFFFSQGNGWKKEGDYRDGRVTKSSMKPNRKVDYLYFTGHGSASYMSLSKNGAFYPGNLGKTSNLKHMIGACCLVGRNTDWFDCFGRGLKTVLTYREVSFDYIDKSVAKTFAQEAAKVNVNNSYGHILAWAKANNTTNRDMRYRWTAYGYDENNELSRYFIDKSARSAETRGPGNRNFPGSEPLVLADGKLVIKADLNNNALLRDGDPSDGGLSDLKPLASKPSGVSTSSLSMLADAKPAETNSNIRGSNAGSMTMSDRKVFELADNGTAVVSNTGAVYMSRSVETLDKSNLDDNAALDKAMNFINSNGGLPTDATLAGIDRIVRETNGQKETVGHLVSFDHEVDGVRASGLMGDGIMVTLAGDSIVGYYRAWNEAGQPVENPEASLQNKNLKQMIINAQNEITAAVKEDVTIEIVNIEYGYRSPRSFDNDGGEVGFTPVVRLIMADGGELTLDAQTGKLVW